MKPTDDIQRPSAGERMSEDEIARQDHAGGGMTLEEAQEVARKHQDAVAEGRARVGEADPDVGAKANDRGSIHPSAGGQGGD